MKHGLRKRDVTLTIGTPVVFQTTLEINIIVLLMLLSWKFYKTILKLWVDVIIVNLNFIEKIMPTNVEMSIEHGMNYYLIILQERVPVLSLTPLENKFVCEAQI